jgi:small subunit ribosomal protein S10
MLDNICGQINDIADRMKVKMKGPIPLPTHDLKVPVRKSPYT